MHVNHHGGKKFEGGGRNLRGKVVSAPQAEQKNQIFEDIFLLGRGDLEAGSG